MGLKDELNEEFDDKDFDDGIDKRLKKSKDSISSKRIKAKNNPKHALTPEKMFCKQEEKDTYSEFFNRFKDEIIEKYGEFSTTQEIALDGVCYAIVRLQRKSMLESNFGRFFDKIAIQDPMQQILAGLKFLGLASEKRNGEESDKSAIGKLLGQDAEELDKIVMEDDSYEAWAASQNFAEVKLRTPKVLPNYSNEDLIIDENQEVL